jgi:NlpC/P60 family
LGASSPLLKFSQKKPFIFDWQLQLPIWPITLRASSIAIPQSYLDPEGKGNYPRATAKDEWAMGKSKTEFYCRVARSFAVAACLAGGCMAESPPAQAQATSVSQGSGSNSRLLSAKEGRAIVDAARDQDQPARGAQDCSHLVHQTYLNAGFEYPYASSFELYAGNENFERVRYAQPGDLIVWPGHTGIVVDPLQHSFYSLVSTGLEAQDYEGSYWKSRGRPRFYRYKVENSEMLTAVKAPPSAPASNSKRPRDAAPAIEARSPVAASASNRPPKAASERTRVVHDTRALPAPAVAATTFEVPQSIIIGAGDKLPTSSQVAEGISELSNASGNVLRADDPTKLALPVVIFERLHVERLEIKRDHGWARLQIDSRATIAGGETDYKRRREKVRWELRRTESGWEAITPADRAYVPNDVAVRNLAAQLARLTERDSAAADQETILRQESQLANLLSALLKNK